MRPRGLAMPGATLLACASLVAAAVGPASAATCTVGPKGIALESYVPSAGGGFAFTSLNANLVIPMDIDEATGTVTVHRDALPVTNVDTQGGPVDVHLEGADVIGTLDANGGMWLPDFGVNTVFGGTISLPTTPDLSTGTQVTSLRDVDVPSQGAALDFTTGLVTLSGADIIPDAPIVSEPVVSGLRLTCRLDPIPDRTKLPRGTTLKGVRGKVSGDTLTLRGTLSTGRPTVDVKTQDVLVHLSGTTGGDIVFLLSRVQQQGSAHSRSLSVLRQAGGTSSPAAGKVTVRGNKKRATLSIKMPGLDLSGLPEQVVARITVGPNDAAVAMVSAAGKLKTAR